MDKLQLLKGTTLFSALSPQDLSVVSALFTEEEFEKDQYIFTEGDPPDWLYIVKEGTIKMVRQSQSGREMILSIMTAGDVIGEVAVFDGGPYPATAQGMGRGIILKLAKKEFVSLLKRHPSIAVEVIGDLGRKLRAAVNVARELRGERVEGRIAMVLLKLARKVGILVEGKVMLTIPLTRQDVADMVGSTIETTIRVISRFKKEGIVSDSKGKMTLDVKRLAEIVKEM
ncbi:MAG: Crp/Fnr family transcriptional regulator [Deltaproteobacteria bacterium]|nr:Crp/Fnr family transcriptional regulator [Deltaproteobacteria bacterium]